MHIRYKAKQLQHSLHSHSPTYNGEGVHTGSKHGELGSPSRGVGEYADGESRGLYFIMRVRTYADYTCWRFRRLQRLRVIMPIDWASYVPVVCVQPGSRYDGLSYMEPVRNIVERNGHPVARADKLTKSDFKTGDKVTVLFQKTKFEGIVDFSREKGTIEEAEGHPKAATTRGGDPKAEGISERALPSGDSTTLKRKRSRAQSHSPERSYPTKRRTRASGVPRTCARGVATCTN